MAATSQLPSQDTPSTATSEPLLSKGLLLPSLSPSALCPSLEVPERLATDFSLIVNCTLAVWQHLPKKEQTLILTQKQYRFTANTLENK